MGGILSEMATFILSDWDTSIIAKRVHVDIPIGQNNKPGKIYIQFRGSGRISPRSTNGLLDDLFIPFQIVSFEANDEDSIKVLRAIKKVLHSKITADSDAEYRITEFQFFEENKLTKLIISGHKRILDGVDEF